MPDEGLAVPMPTWFEVAEDPYGAAPPVELNAPGILELPPLSNEQLAAIDALLHGRFGPAQPVDGRAPDNLAGSRQLNSEDASFPHAFDFPPGEAHFHPGGPTQQSTSSLSCILIRADCILHSFSSPPPLSPPPPLPERVGRALLSECLSGCPSRRPDKQQ